MTRLRGVPRPGRGAARWAIAGVVVALAACGPAGPVTGSSDSAGSGSAGAGSEPGDATGDASTPTDGDASTPTDDGAGTATDGAPTAGGVKGAPARPSPATVTISAPGYDAPGALVMTVATARGGDVDAAAQRGDVRFEASVAGVAGTCEGPTWRHAQGVSQQCWLTLPSTPGAASIQVRAVLTGTDGSVARTAAGVERIEAKGPVTTAVTGEQRRTIERCGNTTDEVWLTFDDGFLRRATMDSMVETLRDKGVRGRFFATGGWARANPSMVAGLRAAGHLVENHTLSHEPLSSQSEQSLRAQIAGGPAADPPRLLRPGYGAGAFASRVVAAAADQGLGTCYWTVDPRDWAGPTAPVLIDRVVHGDHRTPPLRAGGVVLMHMTGRHTAQALPGLIDAIRAQGLTPEPLR